MSLTFISRSLCAYPTLVKAVLASQRAADKEAREKADAAAAKKAAELKKVVEQKKIAEDAKAAKAAAETKAKIAELNKAKVRYCADARVALVGVFEKGWGWNGMACGRFVAHICFSSPPLLCRLTLFFIARPCPTLSASRRPRP